MDVHSRDYDNDRDNEYRDNDPNNDHWCRGNDQNNDHWCRDNDQKNRICHSLCEHASSGSVFLL